MVTFAIIRHPVTTLVTDSTNPDKLTNDLLILNLFQTTRDLFVNKTDLLA